MSIFSFSKEGFKRQKARERSRGEREVLDGEKREKMEATAGSSLVVGLNCTGYFSSSLNI